MSSTSFSRSIGGSNLAVAAAGNSQATATEITAAFNVVTAATTSSADGLVLPTGRGAGDMIVIVNATSVALDVFPPSGGTINGGSADAAVSLRANSTGLYFAIGEDNYGATIDVDTDT